MTHYETLDVPADADTDAIRKGYRKASMKAHPDREGGSEEAMQKVNKAFEVLSDPDKRARYDAGEEEPSGDDIPTQMLREALNAYLDHPNTISRTREALNAAMLELRGSAARAAGQIEKLEARKSRIICKGAGTIPHQLLESRIRAHQRKRESDAATAAYMERALALLNEYEDAPVEPTVNIAQGRNRTMFSDTVLKGNFVWGTY